MHSLSLFLSLTRTYMHACTHAHTHSHNTYNLIAHTLVIAPAITTPPRSIDGALPDSTVTFNVVATGQPLNYQWYMVVNGPDITIDGAVEATLTLTNVTVENEGMYYCIISNRAGSVTSDTVSLTVCKCYLCMYTVIIVLIQRMLKK